jgi:hypothetical protein
MLYKCFKDVLKDVLGRLQPYWPKGFHDIKATDWEY